MPYFRAVKRTSTVFSFFINLLLMAPAPLIAAVLIISAIAPFTVSQCLDAPQFNPIGTCSLIRQHVAARCAQLNLCAPSSPAATRASTWDYQPLIARASHCQLQSCECISPPIRRKMESVLLLLFQYHQFTRLLTNFSDLANNFITSIGSTDLTSFFTANVM